MQTAQCFFYRLGDPRKYNTVLKNVKLLLWSNNKWRPLGYYNYVINHRSVWFIINDFSIKG